jgi:hypothetical protein
MAASGRFSLFPDCIFNAIEAGGASGRFDKSQASASIFGARHSIANRCCRNLL